MDYYLGQISLFPYTFAPGGWMLCDGRSINVTYNEALFSLIGNRFGGDGRTNFNLPNLLGKEPVSNMNYYICISGIYPSRDY